MDNSGINQLAKQLEQNLLMLYGSPILTSEELQKALGYRSIHALRQAITRKTIPVKTFKLPKRRNHYALVKDIALWLATNAIVDKEKNQ